MELVLEIITILTLIIGIITLVVVCFQTYFTKKSMNAAVDSIKLTKEYKQLDLLPKMNFILSVRARLETWQGNLAEIINYFENNNIEKINKIKDKKMVDAKGLVEKHIYENGNFPDWLSNVWLSGAQYYYDSVCLYGYINSENYKEYVDRFNDSHNSIKLLLEYINDKIPDVFLNTPASKSDNDFIG